MSLGSAAGAIQGNAGNLINAPFQIASAVQSRRAMDDALRYNMEQQLGYAGKATRAVGAQAEATGAEAFNRALGLGAANRMAGYSQVAGIPMTYPQSNRDVASAGRDANAIGAMGQNRANLGAYGDAEMMQWLKNQEAARTLQQLISFAGGQATLLPYAMYQAQHKGDNIAAIGNALSSIVTGAQLGASTYGAESQGAPTSNQMSAFNAGYGPVNESYANQIASQTPAQINQGMYSNQYGMPYFQLPSSYTMY